MELAAIVGEQSQIGAGGSMAHACLPGGDAHVFLPNSNTYYGGESRHAPLVLRNCASSAADVVVEHIQAAFVMATVNSVDGPTLSMSLGASSAQNSH